MHSSRTNLSAWCLGACAALPLVLRADTAPAPRDEGATAASAPAHEPPAARDARMAWWRETRFGMFIHWGLYAVPAGEWKDRKDHGEWIMNTGHIPVEEYEKFLTQFN